MASWAAGFRPGVQYQVELPPVEQIRIQPVISQQVAYFKSRVMCLLLQDHLKTKPNDSTQTEQPDYALQGCDSLSVFLLHGIETSKDRLKGGEDLMKFARRFSWN